MTTQAFLLLAMLSAGLVACGGGGDEPQLTVGSGGESSELFGDGGGDALAAAFLRSGDSSLSAHALEHLEITALGAASGASIAGSARNRRLAIAAGSSLDAALRGELDELGQATGASFEGVFPMLFPFRSSAVWFAGTFDRGDPATWRARIGPRANEVDMEHVGHALFARGRVAAQLLTQRRGELLGATAEEGRLAVACLQQALSIEETLLRSLFYDGSALGGIDPQAFDPEQDPRGLARRFAILDEPAAPGVPEAYVVEDAASDLAATAAVLRGAAQLAWMASDRNPEPNLVAAFRGEPFEVALSGAPQPVPQQLNFVADIAPILNEHCTRCHGATRQNGGLSLASFEQLMAGGNSGVPLVVPGDPAASPLWLIVNGPWTNPQGRTIQQMPPFGGGGPNAQQLQVLFDWIESGAQRDPQFLPPPTDIGLGLARSLVAIIDKRHAAPVHDGVVLHHRVSRTGSFDDPSELHEPRATGLVLLALARYRAIPEVGSEVDSLMRGVASAAVSRLTDARGAVVDGFDLRVGSARPGVADLVGQAALTAGLFAAANALGDADLLERARLLGVELVRREFDVRLDPAGAALVVEALVEIRADGAVMAGALRFDEFMDRLVPAAVMAVVDPSLVPTFAAQFELGDGAAAPESGAITWSEHVLPLFRSKCSGCHLFGASLGGIALDSPELIRSSRMNQIVSGDPLGSFLYRKLAERVPPFGAQMPLGQPPLDARGLGLVAEWIRAGARQW